MSCRVKGQRDDRIEPDAADDRAARVDDAPVAPEDASCLRVVGQDPRFEIVHSNFESLVDVVSERGLKQKVDGVLLDLGVSSPQLDDASRGFSFLKPGPLDMRMNPETGQSAAEWLAVVEEDELVGVLRRYGEERFAKRIARAIVDIRKEKAINDTLQLAELISAAVPKKKNINIQRRAVFRLFVFILTASLKY